MEDADFGLQASVSTPSLRRTWLELPDGEVVKACNAIYGLKQSGFAWKKKHRKTITEGNWKKSDHDECLCYHRADDGKIAALTTYVGDILFA